MKRTNISRSSRQKRLERRRLKAVKFFKRGKSQAEVSRLLGVSREATRQWYDAYKNKGVKGLYCKDKTGPKPRLTQSRKKKVEKALIKGPISFGYSTDVWTLSRIAEVIRKVAQTSYHPRYVWYILKSMNWSCQKPQAKAKQRDESAISRWKRTKWIRIKKKPENMHLL